MKMKTVPCIECGRTIRPCNLARHRSTHYPRLRPWVYGHKMVPATRPITLGTDKDRRYDEHVPRGIGPHRFRIYRLRQGELELIASAETPGDFGEALFVLDQEGEFITDDSTGVLDTARDPGHWIVHPWALGRRPMEAAA